MKHPNEIRLIQYLEKSLPADESAAVEKHLNSCPDCLRDLTDLYGLKSDIEKQPQPEPDPVWIEKAHSLYPPARQRPIYPWVMTALAALLLIGLLIWYPGSDGPTVEQYRNFASSLLIATEMPQDGERIEADRAAFSWVLVDGGVNYRFMLFSASGVPLHEEVINNPVADFSFSPDFVFDEGTTYLWRVTTTLADGRQVSSEISSFHIIGNPDN